MWAYLHTNIFLKVNKFTCLNFHHFNHLFTTSRYTKFKIKAFHFIRIRNYYILLYKHKRQNLSISKTIKLIRNI